MPVRGMAAQSAALSGHSSSCGDTHCATTAAEKDWPGSCRDCEGATPSVAQPKRHASVGVCAPASAPELALAFTKLAPRTSTRALVTPHMTRAGVSDESTTSASYWNCTAKLES